MKEKIIEHSNAIYETFKKYYPEELEYVSSIDFIDFSTSSVKQIKAKNSDLSAALINDSAYTIFINMEKHHTINELTFSILEELSNLLANIKTSYKTIKIQSKNLSI